MSELHLSILFFAFLLIVVKSHGSMTLDLGTELVVPAFTPFTKNGDINRAVVKKMAQKYARDNITAILIGSYAGEGPSMDLCTRQELIKAWVEAGVRRGLKIMVDVAAIAFPDKLKLVEFCAKIDVTAIFVLPELAYQAKNINEIIEDLKAIYRVAPRLRMIFHDLRFLTNSVVSSIEVWKEASLKIPTFVGMATDYNTAVDLQRIVGPIDPKDKLVIVIGNDVNTPLALKIGIHLSVWPSLFPELVLKIVAAINAGDCEKAADLQKQRLNKLITGTGQIEDEVDIDFTRRTFLENTKFAYQLITDWDLNQRLPLREVDENEAAKIKACLFSEGIINIKYRVVL